MLQPHLKLYGNIFCPFVQRVRFALESLKLQYDYIEIDLLAQKHLKEKYLAINPFACVPTINFNNSSDLTIIPIKQFGNVFPKDITKRAEQRIWANYYDQNVISNIWEIFQIYKSKDEEGLKKLANKLADDIRYQVKQTKLSERVKINHKTFYEGEQLIYVDFAVVPHTRYIKEILFVSLQTNNYSIWLKMMT
ncbi:hypothetical protein ABPG74_005994 [Tetrahymena malaccensis]